MTLRSIRGKASAGILSLALLAATAPLSAWAEDQPHMREALEALQKARQELQAAEHDKGGHRAKALALTDQAIAQTKMGMQYDENHERGKNKDKDRDRDRDKR